MSGRNLSSQVLFVGGIALLIVPALHIAGGARFPWADDSALAEAAPPIPRPKPEPAIAAPPLATSGARAPRPEARPPRRSAVRSGEAWGRIAIPRVGLDWVVVEGVGDADLRRGPGHVPDTAGPGAPDGNCVIAGHRNSFFGALARVRKGDVVLVRGLDGRLTSYRLESRRIVTPEEVSVMEPTPDRRLTLITCYPFGWFGDAPYRLVWNGVAAGETAPATTDPVPPETPERAASTR